MRERERLTEGAPGGPWVALDEIRLCLAARVGASPTLSSSQVTTYDKKARGHRFFCTHARRQASRQIGGWVLTTDPAVQNPVAQSDEWHRTISSFARFGERSRHVLYPLELVCSQKSVGAAAIGPDPVIQRQQQHENL